MLAQVAKQRQAPIKVAGLGDLSIREYRSALAKAKRAGLVSSKIDARSHKPTRYMRGQLAKFSNVVKGNAKAVKLPKREQAKAYSDLYKVKGKLVAVPLASGERVYWSRRDKAIAAVRHTGFKGAEFSRMVIRPREADAIPDLEPGESYVIPWAQGGGIWYQRIENKEELIKLITKYEEAPDRRKRRSNTQSWSSIRQYIGIVNYTSELD